MILNENIEAQLKSIEASERMRECLQVRVKLSRTNFASKNEYEKNEVEILEMKSQAQIDKLSQVIFEKKELFDESFGILMRELEEQESYAN